MAKKKRDLNSPRFLKAAAAAAAEAVKAKKMQDNPLVGRTIVDVRLMTPDEREKLYWGFDRTDGPAVVIVLDDGACLFASRDVEGNGSGTMFGFTPDGDVCSFSAGE